MELPEGDAKAGVRRTDADTVRLRFIGWLGAMGPTSEGTRREPKRWESL